MCTDEVGFARAQFSLGVMYTLGAGVPKDPVVAYMWASLAAANGYEQGSGFRATLEKGLTSSQIDEGRRMMWEWLALHEQAKAVDRATQPETSR